MAIPEIVTRKMLVFSKKKLPDEHRFAKSSYIHNDDWWEAEYQLVEMDLLTAIKLLPTIFSDRDLYVRQSL